MINYERVKEIGATHYHNRTGEMYQVDIGDLLVFRRGSWVNSCLPLGEAVSEIKPIPPKHTRTEYEKVELACVDESMLDDVFIDNFGGVPIRNASVAEFLCCNLYRKVEKEIDERQEFVERCMEIARQGGTISDKIWLSKIYDIGCRFVGANWEIE